MKTSLKNFLKKYKGVFFKKNGFLDYTELHAYMKGVLKGLTVFRPSTLQNKTAALHMDLEQWENSEGHYSDSGMLTSYTVKMALLFNYSPEVVQWLTLTI